jgi:phosphosulfolactate synthase
MTEHTQQEVWVDSLEDPSACRLKKPRKSGLTMIMDKGLGVSCFKDFLETSSMHIDYIKLGFGTSALYPIPVLEKKISLAKQYGVPIYPGGTFFEVAYLQGKLKEYFCQIKQLGFEAVEISDGTISLPREKRKQVIQLAKEMGFDVLTECGKKISGSTLELLQIRETLFEDLKNGATYMIVEGRESGENVGIYNSEGEADEEFITSVTESLEEYTDYLIWEAPKKNQHVTFISQFGFNVNLGNVSPSDIFSVEALRRGLRSDTLLTVHQHQHTFQSFLNN